MTGSHSSAENVINTYEMRKILFLILPSIFYLSACSNYYDGEIENEYYLTYIDSSTFEKYNLLFLANPDSEMFYVLSTKDSPSQKIRGYKVSKLLIGMKYSLHLTRLDTTVTAKLRFIPTRQIEIYYNDKKTIWQQDTFKTDIHMTYEIRGLFLIKKIEFIFLPW